MVQKVILVNQDHLMSLFRHQRVRKAILDFQVLMDHEATPVAMVYPAHQVCLVYVLLTSHL